jgi:uncharacterized protein
LELTRQAAGDRQVIQAYGTGAFRVSGVTFASSIFVMPAKTLAWGVTRLEDLSEQAFAPLLAEGTFDVCLLGCGATMQLVPDALRAALKNAGLTVDPMATGAACRTYNVLAGEGRRVAAALIRV